MRKSLFILFILLPFLSIQSQTETDSIFIFIGEKIKVEQFTPQLEPDAILMDAAFEAEYKVLKGIYGYYPHDTIRFEAYDHYGFPPFGKYKNVLLFLFQAQGEYFHMKYQFFPLYKTKDGRWASCYSTDYNREDIQSTDLKPEIIDFAEEVSFDIEGLSDEAVAEYYPSPYFKIEGNKAIAVWGNYVEDLFELKKKGVLNARGYF